MCRAFQTAEAVSVGDTFSVRSPSEARCAFTRLITWPARAASLGLNEAGAVQSPAVAAGEASGTTASAAAHAATANDGRRRNTTWGHSP
jgi:hypothetical protein